MATRRKKTRRMRGSRTHGWGVSGQHRDSGMRGGRGKSGTFKHKWTSVLRYGEVEKGGFMSPKGLKKRRAINVGELNLLTQTTQSGKGPTTLDLTSLGFDKLLGRGLVQMSFNIKVAKSSRAAAKKIADAGGAVATGG
jgi:large subunit ribosomal protein L15